MLHTVEYSEVGPHMLKPGPEIVLYFLKNSSCFRLDIDQIYIYFYLAVTLPK